MHTTTYDRLYATSLTPEFHEKTCGYWFTVTAGAMSHTAFATRAGLDHWLNDRGLSLENDLPDSGQFGTTRIIGKYLTTSHGEFSPTEDDPYRMVEDDDWNSLRPIMATAAMSNGRYTLALITEDDDGVRTVHTLNPNIKTRIEFDHQHTARWLAS